MLLGACGAAVSPATKPIGDPSPVVASSGSPLGEIRLARVAAARAAVDSALADWHLTDHGSSCTLLFSEREEWLVGCGDAMDGFAPTGETLFAHPVLHLPQSLVLAGQLMPFESIKLSIVGTVGTWHRDSGDGLPVLLLQDWETLHAHHPGFQQAPISEWFGIYVHEAFHAHQMWHPSVRRALTDLANQTPSPVSKDDLAAFYREHTDYEEAIKDEYDLLKAASLEPLSATQAQEILRQWIALYDERVREFAPQLEAAFPGRHPTEMDAFYTFLEGSARYVEVRFLISPPTETFSGLSSLDGSDVFAATRGKHPSDVAGLGGIGPKYVYSIGMYVCLLLDVASPEWQRALLEHPGLLIGFVRGL